MTKPKPLKGRTWNPYTIPDVINPGGVRCVQVYIPDSLQWLQILAAALDTMCHWKNYELLGDTSAGQCAALMRSIVNLYPLGDCEECTESGGTLLEDAMSSQIRIKPEDTCIIQMWCIDHWEDWYNPRSCIPGAVVQPPPGGTVAAGDCKNYSLTLAGNNRVRLPVPVDDNFVITISGATGGWWDGDVLHAWQCPSGFTYALGECVSTGPANPAGPAPLLPYGRLIAEVGSAFLDAYNTVIVVPPGTGPVDMYFQMNDDTLSDNQGSVQFDVQVCSQITSSLGITYLSQGHGPSTASVNEFFTVASDPFGSENAMHVQFSECIHLEVVSVTGFTPFTGGSGVYVWDYYLCGGTHIVKTGADNPTSPLALPSGTQVTQIGGTSQTAWSMVLKVLSIP